MRAQRANTFNGTFALWKSRWPIFGWPTNLAPDSCETRYSGFAAPDGWPIDPCAHMFPNGVNWLHLTWIYWTAWIGWNSNPIWSNTNTKYTTTSIYAAANSIKDKQLSEDHRVSIADPRELKDHRTFFIRWSERVQRSSNPNRIVISTSGNIFDSIKSSCDYDKHLRRGETNQGQTAASRSSSLNPLIPERRSSNPLHPLIRESSKIIESRFLHPEIFSMLYTIHSADPRISTARRTSSETWIVCISASCLRLSDISSNDPSNCDIRINLDILYLY